MVALITRRGRIFGLLTAFLLVILPILVQPLTTLADSRPVIIFGPVTIERATGKPTVNNYRIVLPESITGPFTFQIQNGTNGAPSVTSARISLNGIEVFNPSDFKKKVFVIERSVELLPVNIIDIAIQAASKPGSQFTITILGIDTSPEEIILAEERGTIGAGGGILSLADVGEIELGENPTRPAAEISVRKLKAPALQELFATDIPSNLALQYTDTIFEVESPIDITTPTAVRVVVPPTFASSLPQGEQIDLFALVDGGNSLSFESLNAIYDPVTNIASATIPPFAWRTVTVEEPVANNPTFIKTALAATTVQVVRIQVATSSGTRQIEVRGQLTSIAGRGANLFVAGNERLTIGADIQLVMGVPIRPPFDFSPLPPISSPFGAGHPLGIDYNVDNATPPPVVAAHDGTIEFKYVTNSSGGCTNSLYKEPGTNNILYGYGYQAIISNRDASGQVYYTRYAHLKPGSALVSPGPITKGTPIAISGNAGCSSGEHLHFEYSVVMQR
jgi:murein DD-endopeptidase MepM/ murein hydrolase activator NlpD